jgi:hypothetical protein
MSAVVLFERLIARYVNTCSGKNAELVNVKEGGTYSYTLFLRAKILLKNEICDLELTYFIHRCRGIQLRYVLA